MKSLFGCMAALIGLVSVARASEDRFVAHEWGTFTSVQGADGLQMEWNPFVVAELPQFVYDRNRPNHEPNRMNFATFAAKTAFMARQRMETPVIYFYSSEPRTADVRVDFPSGLITEWFPRASSCDAERRGPNRDDVKKNSFLEWKSLDITASQAGAEKLPMDQGKSHYYAARETDASLLNIRNEAKGTTETEKFLFYRGVGHFEAPLQTSLAGDVVVLKNNGREDLRHLLILRVQDGKAKTYSMARVDALSSGVFEKIPLAQLKLASRDELKASLQKALASEKLYPAEARSMVKTWEDSWLDEPGLRVLYVLGTKWTDETLPLKISPAPDEIVRVMVGRAEVITPAMEIALQKSINEYRTGDRLARERALAKARAIGLGRFVDAAARRLCRQNPGAEFSKAAFELANKVSQPPQPAPVASTVRSSGFSPLNVQTAGESLQPVALVSKTD